MDLSQDRLYCELVLIMRTHRLRTVCSNMKNLLIMQQVVRIYHQAFRVTLQMLCLQND